MSNITFMIGNGFDLGLGLKTRYTDFLKVYTKKRSNDEEINAFRREIKRDIKTWADAELAMGEYTSHFDKQGVDKLRKCYDDFLKEFSEYLKKETKWLGLPKLTNELEERVFRGLRSFLDGLPDNSIDAVKKTLEKQGDLKYEVINFNYTSTFDDGFLFEKKGVAVIDFLTYGEKRIRIGLGEICHIHGKIGDRMIMGVDNESQIANIEFRGTRRFIRSYMKPKVNEALRTRNDAWAKEIVENSCVICVYGMSLGATDRKWWKLVMDWLISNPSNQLIVHTHREDYNPDIPGSYLDIVEDDIENMLFGYSDYTDEQRKEASERIHISINSNIFGDKLVFTLHILLDFCLRFIGLVDFE